MLQLHLIDQQFFLPTKVHHILEAWQYCQLDTSYKQASAKFECTQEDGFENI